MIDHDQYPSKVLGVFREHPQAEEFLLSLPEEESCDLGVDVVCWDIVNNREAV